MFLLGKLFTYEKRILIASAAGILLVAATLVYIKLKPYPMDYVDGKLLVDPQKMMPDTFKGCGGLLGLIIGSFIERRWVRYRVPEGHSELPVLAAAGLGIVFTWNQYLAGATVIPLLGSQWGQFAMGAMQLLFVTALYPAFIMRVTGTKKAEKEAVMS